MGQGSHARRDVPFTPTVSSLARDVRQGADGAARRSRRAKGPAHRPQTTALLRRQKLRQKRGERKEGKPMSDANSRQATHRGDLGMGGETSPGRKRRRILGEHAQAASSR